ncbi:hypothetical protein KCU78_g20421, partial [Aureobasidium melanogenum]
MVSTRSHPQDFAPQTSDEVAPQTPSKRTPSSMTMQSTTHQGYNNQRPWSHTPSLLTLAWLAVSLPLVIWDTFYVFLRPHSMPGGKYQKPLWSAVNVVECAGYIYYLYLVYAYGRTEDNVQGTGAPDKERVGTPGQSRTVYGKTAAQAVVLLYGVALMTLSKTVLYWLNEAFSGFANIGHNSASDILFLWALPNGLWIILPIYLVYVSAKEILEGLEVAVSSTKKSQ